MARERVPRHGVKTLSLSSAARPKSLQDLAVEEVLPFIVGSDRTRKAGHTMPSQDLFDRGSLRAEAAAPASILSWQTRCLGLSTRLRALSRSGKASCGRRGSSRCCLYFAIRHAAPVSRLAWTGHSYGLIRFCCGRGEISAVDSCVVCSLPKYQSHDYGRLPTDGDDSCSMRVIHE